MATPDALVTRLRARQAYLDEHEDANRVYVDAMIPMLRDLLAVAVGSEEKAQAPVEVPPQPTTPEPMPKVPDPAPAPHARVTSATRVPHGPDPAPGHGAHGSRDRDKGD